MNWKQAAIRYIIAYQWQHMRPLHQAPASLQLHIKVMRKNGLPFRLARLGYYDPNTFRTRRRHDPHIR